jgi:hypothetical protein
VFQSRVVEGEPAAEVEGFAEVEACLIRHSEGVKNDEGGVDAGRLAARG